MNQQHMVPLAVERHIDILRDMLFQLAERVTGEVWERTEESYLLAKQSTFLGHLGREWQIGWGAGMRGVSRNIFSRDLKVRIDRLNVDHGVEFFAVDDLGFEHEVEFAKTAYDRLTIIYLEKRLEYTYVHGENFHKDSRFCLRDYATFIDPTPAEVAAYLIRE